MPTRVESPGAELEILDKRIEPIVEAVAIESEPPEIVSGSVEVRLLIESATLSE